MTNREFFTAIATSELSDDFKAFANAELAKLNERNAKRRNTPTKAQVANEPIKEAIVAYLAENKGAVASAIASAVGVTTQKVTALCTILNKEGKVVIGEVKIKGKGVLKAYSLAEAE